MSATKATTAIKDILDDAFDAIIQNFNQKASIPGLTLMVHQHATPSRPGETIYRSYGVAYDDHPMTPQYEYIAKLPCPDLPGTAFSYSTLLYDVCVLAIEMLAGENIEVYLDRIFFKPLGLDRTSFEGEGREDAAEGYIGGEAATGANKTGSPMFPLPFGKSFGFQAVPREVAWKGTGRLITCAEDTWMAYFPTDPFYTAIASPRVTANSIVRPGMSILDKDEQYGFGFFTGSYRGVPYIERWGAVSGFSGLMTYLPTLGISVVSLNNSSEGGEVGSLITGLIVSRLMGDNAESVIRSITDEMVERVRDETIDFASVPGAGATSSDMITGTYIGSGIGKLVFDAASNVQHRPQCVTLPWLCWLHGDVKPIIAYLGEGKYAGCLEYRQWERHGTAEVVRYGSPFRMERVEGSDALWVSECYLSEPFLLHRQ